MPLPDAGSVWPPKHLAPAFLRMGEHDAWYLGDIGRLQDIYSTDRALPTHVRNGAAYTGGVVGTVGRGLSRMWWGRRSVSDASPRTAVHFPLAADVATMVSDSLWAEPAVFTAGTVGASGQRATASELTQSRLDLIMNSPDARMMFNEAGEPCSALGGTYYTADWNPDIADHVYVTAHDADSAVPEWAGRRLRAVTFWSTYAHGDQVYRHLERHEQGVILHGLYEGVEDELGDRVPFDVIDETQWLAALSSDASPLEVALPTGLRRLTVAYQPNVRPSREMRRAQGGLSMFGRSDFQGSESQLNQLDEVWSSWMRDLKVARSRVFVDESMLKSRGFGQGASWDEEQEVYTVLRSMAAQDNKQIEAHQFEIRVAEHERTALAITRAILRNAGLGSRDYDDNVSGQITATGENRLEKREETSRDKRIRYASAATTEIASVALELDRLLFPGKGGAEGIQVGAEFPATQQSDPEKDARVISLLEAAKAISLDTKVRRANPDWDEPRIAEELTKLRAEQGTPAPDPDHFDGIDEAQQ